MPLQNAKHEAVAQHFFADPERIGWKAYVAVYPKSSEAASKTAFSRLLKNADFQARIAELTAAAAAAGVMSLQEVLRELSVLGKSTIQDLLAVNGGDTAELLQALRELPRDAAAAIRTLTVDTYVEGAGEDARAVKRVRLEMHDKRAALNSLLAYLAPAKPQKHEHSGKDGGPIETKPDLSELEIARRLHFLLTQASRGGGKPKKKE